MQLSIANRHEIEYKQIMNLPSLEEATNEARSIALASALVDRTGRWQSRGIDLLSENSCRCYSFTIL